MAKLKLVWKRSPHRLRSVRWLVWMGLGMLLVVLVACSRTAPPSTPAAASPALRIYWNQGFYPAEDQAFQEIVADWERQTGNQVELSVLNTDDILNQTTFALENGTPPDIVFAHRADHTLQPIWSWEGKLADVSEILEPLKEQLTPSALRAAYLYNKVEDKRSYYGVPIELQTIHIHYWRDLLAQIGVNDAEIPNDWDGFWRFWQQSQNQLRKRGHPDLYGLGTNLSAQGSDTYYFFEQVLDAYNIKLLNEQGQLLLNDPQVHQRLVKVLKWFCQFYQGGYTPADAVNWVDADNNTKFLNREILMTLNPSLSIPASQRQDKELYYKKIATREFPNQPDGKPIRYLVSVKQALIFKDAQHLQLAKDFLAFVVEPERLNTYVKRSLGRWFPVMSSAMKDPFWTDATDPHISVATKQFLNHSTRPLYHVFNPAYSKVQAENIWGKAIGHVLVDKWTAEAAVEEAIASIERIFTEWEHSA